MIWGTKDLLIKAKVPWDCEVQNPFIINLSTIGYGLGGKGFFSWQRQDIEFPSPPLHAEHLLGHMQPNNEWVQRVLSFGSRGWDMNLTFHRHLVWMSGANIYSHNTQCCHAWGEFYLYDVLEITLSIACRGNLIFKK